MTWARRPPRRGGLVSGIGAAAAVAWLTACSAVAPAAPTSGAAPASTVAAAPAAAAPIKLGVLADVSAAFANQGAMMHVMTDYAIQEANAHGGVNGRPLQALYADPKGDPNQAVQFATEFVQRDQVDALIGAVSSAECLGVQGQAAKLRTLYLTSTGCATDDLTSASCDKYTFRPGPQGTQTSDPLAGYLVKQVGPRWAMLYQDYALGQSYQKTWDASLRKAGGALVTKIAMPLGEANVLPYVSKIPADGSVDGFLPPVGGTDQARVMAAFQQLGLGQKMVVAGAVARENFGGVWPDVLDGQVFLQSHPSEAVPGDALDEAWVKGATALAGTEAEKPFADIMGGVQYFGPGGQGYQAYIAVTALKEAMIAAGYASKADTDKVIAALETLDVPQSPDFPAGRFIMNKADHQGRTQEFIMRLHGQEETIVQVVPATDVPPIGTCSITA
jgi:branched-chain amino acid transport system substrate-binding protein